MAPTATKGPHGSFDIPPSITVKHSPAAFLTSPLPYGTDGMSSQQLAQLGNIPLYCWDYLCLLCLPLTDFASCNCRAPLPAFGDHQLTCSKWAGRLWKSRHDIVVLALAFEICRLGMGLVDRHQHPDFIVDVKACAMVTGDGIGRPYGMLTRVCLRTIPLLWALHTANTQADNEKFRKHDTNYAAVGLAFFPLFWAALAVLAPMRRDFCALWLFWNFDSMMLSVNVLA